MSCKSRTFTVQAARVSKAFVMNILPATRLFSRICEARNGLWNNKVFNCKNLAMRPRTLNINRSLLHMANETVVAYNLPGMPEVKNSR